MQPGRIADGRIKPAGSCTHRTPMSRARSSSTLQQERQPAALAHARVVVEARDLEPMHADEAAVDLPARRLALPLEAHDVEDGADARHVEAVAITWLSTTGWPNV